LPIAFSLAGRSSLASGSLSRKQMISVQFWFLNSQKIITLLVVNLVWTLEYILIGHSIHPMYTSIKKHLHVTLAGIMNTIVKTCKEGVWYESTKIFIVQSSYISFPNTHNECI